MTLRMTAGALAFGALCYLLPATQAGAQASSCSDFPSPAKEICRAYCSHDCGNDSASPGCSTWLRRWHKLTGLNSVPCEPSRCEPQVCGEYTQCDVELSCFCFEVAEGGGLCIDNFFCDGAEDCPNGTSDCPAGEVCTVNTCCGTPKCTPVQCTGETQAPEGGGTAAGN